MRALAEYVMLGRKQAVGLALLFACIPFFNWLSVAIIGLVTLRKGLTEGVVVLACAAIPALGFLVAGNIAPFINNVLFDSLIVLAMAALLRESNSWTVVLQATALLAIAAIMLTFSLNPDMQDWWLQRFNTALQASDMQKIQFDMNPAQLKKMLQTSAKLATGAFAFAVVGLATIKLVIARWMQAQLYNPGGLKRELYQIRLGTLATVLLMLAVLGALNKQSLAVNVLPVVMWLYAMACMSLAHRLTALTQKQMFWLLGFYTLTLVLFPASIGFLVIVALIDSWVNINESFQKALAKRKIK